MGIPTFSVSISAVVVVGEEGCPITNLHSAFDHEALESSNACFNEGHKVVLQVFEQFPDELRCSKYHELTALSGMTPPQKPTSVQH